MIRKSYSICCCFILMCCIGEAAVLATAVAPWKAWIEWKQNGENARIVSQFRNDGTEKLRLTYQLTVERQAASGRSTNHQQGEFEATPGSTTLLSEVNLNLRSVEPYRILLEVFNNKERIAVDSLVNGKIKKQPISRPLTSNQDSELELDGLIIDETRSKIGGDFYDVFYRNWSAPKEARDFVIRVKELPSRGRIARVSIEVNNQEVTQRVLQPRSDIIRSQAIHAIRVIQRKLLAQASVNKELGSEDQEGSGIF